MMLPRFAMELTSNAFFAEIARPLLGGFSVRLVLASDRSFMHSGARVATVLQAARVRRSMA